MLDTFRKASQSWFIKILFGLLIISFIVFFGNSSELLHLSTNRPAIVVGHQEIGAQEVAEEFRRDVERLQRLFNTRVTLEQARDMGLLQQTVSQIVNRSLLNQAARDEGFTLDDASLRRMIAETPAFQNQLNQFDKDIYQRTLAHAGLSEAAFVKMSREDAIRQDVVRLVQSGTVAPAAESDPLFRYRFERRVADTILVPVDKSAKPAAADEAKLKEYWTNHPDLFTAPELRGFTAAVVRVQDLSTAIKPKESDVEKSYQVRQSEFQTPERRAISQVIFADQKQAQDFAAKAQGNFAAAAKQAGKDVVDLGVVTRKDMPLSQLADAAFALPSAGIAAPVQSPLGWHVLAIASIQPAKIKPLAEVRDTIMRDLVKDEATNRLFTLSTKLEDAMGSGAPVEEAAASAGVAPLKVAAMDETGKTPDGKPVAGIPDSPAFRATLFQTGQGSNSEVKPLEGDTGYFVLHVDKVTAPALKPFETVRDQVLAAWNAEERRTAAHRQAEALAERLKKGDPIAQVGKGFTVAATQPFRRSPTPQAKDLPPLLIAEMFKAQPGGVAVVDLPNGTLVAQLKSVLPADPKADQAAYDDTRQQLAQAMAADLMQQYLAALQKEYGVNVRQAMIDRQFEGSR